MTEPFAQPVDPMSLGSKQNEEYKKAIRDMQLALDQKTLAVFNSPEGDALLEMWDDYFIRQGVIILGAPAGENEMREGRNQFIRRIRAVVNRARNA